MNNDFGIGERAPWNNFPDVIRNSDLYSLQKEPEYVAAKSGDLRSALILIEKSINDNFIDQLRQLDNDSNIAVVPVRSVEASGNNKIPLALGIYISNHLNIELERSIVQIDKVFRTNTGADHRLAFSPRFEGSVEPNKKYIILDDNLTMGGTLASLRGYINNRGGNVVGAAVICARSNPSLLSLPIKDKMYNDILNKHGQQINDFWKETFNYGIDKLTHSEAGHIRRAGTFDEIRNRIIEARNAGLRISMQTTNRGNESSNTTENETINNIDDLINHHKNNSASKYLENVSNELKSYESLGAKNKDENGDIENNKPTSPRLR